MPTDSPSPAAQLGAMTKFLGLLRFDWEQIQVVIDHPNVRQQAREALHAIFCPPDVRLIRAIKGHNLSLTEAHRLAAETDFKELKAELNERHRLVIERRFYEYPRTSLDELAGVLDTTHERVRQMETGAISTMRRALLAAEKWRQTQTWLDHLISQGHHLLEELKLSDHLWSVLRRHEIYLIEQLTQKTSTELLAFHDFDQKSLDEVIRALFRRGLKLPDDPKMSEPPPL